MHFIREVQSSEAEQRGSRQQDYFPTQFKINIEIEGKKKTDAPQNKACLGSEAYWVMEAPPGCVCVCGLLRNMWATPPRHPPQAVRLLFLHLYPILCLTPIVAHSSNLCSTFSLFIPSSLSTMPCLMAICSQPSLSPWVQTRPAAGRSAWCLSSNQRSEKAPLVSNWSILAAQLADDVPLTFNQLPTKTKPAASA